MVKLYSPFLIGLAGSAFSYPSDMLSFNSTKSSDVITLHKPRQMGQPNTAHEDEYRDALLTNPTNTITLTLYRDGVDGQNKDPRCLKSNIPDRNLKFHLQSAFEANGDTPIENKNVAKLFSIKDFSLEELEQDERHVQIFVYYCDSFLPAQLRFVSYGKLANRFKHEAELAMEAMGGSFNIKTSVKILSWDKEAASGLTFWKKVREEMTN